MSELGSLTGFYQTVDPASLQLSNLSDFICERPTQISTETKCHLIRTTGT